jgi:hypothetical protein
MKPVTVFSLFRKAVLLGAASACVFSSFSAQAFCGFYVGKADASLFNEASQVILARDGNRTVISMLNDYKGALSEFAMVVPVPSVLGRDQIRVGQAATFARLDSYSAPRLAEYHDPNPCEGADKLAKKRRFDDRLEMAPQSVPAPAAARGELGVRVEATYTVGEYDIVILDAKQSDGLETWLIQNGYKVPAGASRALKPYIGQGLKFFVAKVNLKEQAKSGLQTLRPLQFAFESERFMLPIRLGMVNANGPQDLIAFIITRQGRVEASNYRTVKLPANMDLPPMIRNDFKGFYKTLFNEQAQKEDHRVVFTEYFWDMSWCDPCAANPLSVDELKNAGVFWMDDGQTKQSRGPGVAPTQLFEGGARPAMLTRLHVRYTPQTFPEDLMFTETKDKANFQTRYVMRHPWTGNPKECEYSGGKEQLSTYLNALKTRQEKEVQQLASLTGWNITDLRGKSDLNKTTQRLDALRISQNQPDLNGDKWWSNVFGSTVQ